MKPVTIIGGGVAGLTLGIGLRQHDVPVTVHERGRYPRHRVCGEFLSGVSDSVLHELGLDPVFAPAETLTTMAWYAGGRRLHRSNLPVPARGLSRYHLDAALAERFRAAGGRLRTNHAGRTTATAGTVMATGRAVCRSPWLGLKIHCRDLEMQADLEMHVGRAGYVGLARIENERVNVCGLFRLRHPGGRGPGLLDQYLRANQLARLADRVQAGQPDPASWKTTAGFGFGWSPAQTTDPVCRIGDHAVMIPPFTGNGMSMALESGFEATTPLAGYAAGTIDWAAACHRVQQALPRRFAGRIRAASAMHPLLFSPPAQRAVGWLMQRGWLPLHYLYRLTRN
jgi:2-polyprenyl-6-methoxyphenol hydroxylase-like FAD-dependent oxidoreductase